MYEKEQIVYIQEKARILRKSVIEMIGVGKAGHLGGSFSAADIVAVLYFHKMKIQPENLKNPERDRFLLSKGHAALIQYAALAELGYIAKEELKKVKSLGAILQGHPDFRKTPGVEANTGSLGQGLSIACGMALGLKLDESKNKVYVIIGDGEMAEGQIWEAALTAPAYKLDNLVAVLDKNNIQATGSVEECFNTNPAPEKWSAFGWEVLRINGHNIEEILQAFDDADKIKNKPVMIIADTIKGKGVSFAENTADFHNGIMTVEQYESALAQLSI